MFEGSATTRKSQIFTGIVLGLFGLPFVYFGAAGIFKTFVSEAPGMSLFVVLLVSFMVGILAELIAYRLILAQGVIQGGGLLTPASYKVLGFCFMLLSLISAVHGIMELSIGFGISSLASAVIGYWCFVAARHRGAMRNIPKWKK